MKFEIEEVAPCVKALKIEVPRDVVVERLSLAFAHLYKTTHIAGFRPGKVPRALVDKRYGAALRGDVLRDLVSDHYIQALDESNLHPSKHLGYEITRAEADSSLSFTAKIEVMPTLPELHYTGLRVPSLTVNVGEADLEVALTQVQNRNGVVEPWPDDHQVATGDVVTISYIEMIEGKPAPAEAQTHTVHVGKGTTAEAIESALLGKGKGETVEVDIPRPSAANPDVAPSEGTEIPSAAGKVLRFSMTITNVQKKTLPPIDDDLARDEEYDSLVAMREGLRQKITTQAKRRQRQAQKDLLIDQVVAAHPFDLPPSMVDAEIHALIEQAEKENGSGGRTEEHQHAPDLPHGHDALHQKYEPVARHRLKAYFLLLVIAQTENIEVTEQDFDDLIHYRETEMGFPMDTIRNLVTQDKEWQNRLMLEIQEEKTIDRLLSLAQFYDTVVTTPEIPAVATA